MITSAVQSRYHMTPDRMVRFEACHMKEWSRPFAAASCGQQGKLPCWTTQDQRPRRTVVAAGTALLTAALVLRLLLAAVRAPLLL